MSAPKHDDYNLHNEAQAALVVLRAMAMAESNDGQPAEIDDETAEIVIQGESNLTEAIESALLANAEDEAHVKAIAAVVAELKARAERKVSRIDSRKAAVLSALEIVGRKKLELATHTVTACPGRAKVLIIRKEAIPAEFMRIPLPPEPEPDKVKIAAAFNAKDPVPGCEMSNPMPYLRVTV